MVDSTKGLLAGLSGRLDSSTKADAAKSGRRESPLAELQPSRSAGENNTAKSNSQSNSDFKRELQKDTSKSNPPADSRSAEKSYDAKSSKDTSKTQQAKSRQKVEGQGPSEVEDLEENSTPLVGYSEAAVAGPVKFAVLPENSAQVPVSEFIEAMESELGVGPEELLSAMAQMPDEEMLNPPRETVDSLMNGLNLEGEERQQAEALYQKMLNQIDEVDSKSGRFQQKVKMEVLSPHELRQQRLSQSIENLNKKFFLNDTRPLYGKAPVDGQVVPMTNGQKAEQISAHFQNIKSADEYGAEQGIAGDDVALFDDSMAEVPQDTSGQNQNLNRIQNQTIQQKQDNSTRYEQGAFPLVETSTGAAALAAQANGKSAAVTSPDTTASSASNLESQLLEAFDLIPSAEIVNAPSDLGSNFGSESQMGGESSGFIPASMTAATSENQESEEMESVLADELASLQSADTKSTDSAKETTLKVVDSFNRAEPNINERTENLREIIQGARALVKDGGGQMNLKLTPEGMGEIQLKVAVNKGNVDVQMITNNSETKRHLETAVSDLRSGLAQQKLTLDTVRVDMNGAGLGQEMDMTNSGNHQREMAQEFMQQFRDQNNSFKHAFYTGPSRGTKDPLDRPDVKPEGSNSPRSDGKSKHINVTA